MRRATNRVIGLIVALGALTIVPLALAADSKQAKPDLSGTWKLDAAHSDMPPAGGPGGRGMRGDGGMGGPGPRMGGDRPMGRPGGGGFRLPELIRIEGKGGEVRISDSTGTLVQEITTAQGAPPAPAMQAPGAGAMGRRDSTTTDSASMARPGMGMGRPSGMPGGGMNGMGAPGGSPPTIAGRWEADHLVVERTGWDGSRITQTWSLKDDGRTLVIRTQMPANDMRPARVIERVYQKVNG